MRPTPGTRPKWTLPDVSTMSTLMNERVRGHIDARFRDMGLDSWADAVNDRTFDLLSEADVRAIDVDVVSAFMDHEGRRLLASAEVSISEAPERYMLRSVWEAAQRVRGDVSEFPEGVIGLGDNVFSAPDVVGTALVLRSVAAIRTLIDDGVPEGTIGVIDDAGGTMTAPILPEFSAMLCRAGTVRSHLAIIAREYGVPTLMGVVFAREPVDGEVLTIRCSIEAQSHEAYLGGEMRARAAIEETLR